MNITITTTAKTDEEARALLAAFKFPFRVNNMAKLALINREDKRAKLVAKFAAKREQLMAVINNASLSDEERLKPV